MPKELAQAAKLKESIENALDEFTERGDQTKTQRKINRVGPDSVLVKGPQGTHCGHNMQNVVDDKNGLIVYTEVVVPTSAQPPGEEIGPFDKAKFTYGHMQRIKAGSHNNTSCI